MEKILLALHTPFTPAVSQGCLRPGVTFKAISEDRSIIILELNKAKMNELDVRVALYQLSNFGEVVRGN